MQIKFLYWIWDFRYGTDILAHFNQLFQIQKSVDLLASNGIDTAALEDKIQTKDCDYRKPQK